MPALGRRPAGLDSGASTGDTGQAAAEGTETGQQNQTRDSGSEAGEKSSSDKPDFEALYKQLQAQARKWETRAKDNAGKAKKWDEAEAANRTDVEQAADRAEKAEARAQAALTAAVSAEIRAAAHGWANPADAPRYLDDKTRYVGDVGEIDTTSIAEDVAAVLKDRPHLAAAKDGKRGPAPDASQGARGGTSIADQIRVAERKGDHRAALALKTQQLLDTRKR